MFDNKNFVKKFVNKFVLLKKNTHKISVYLFDNDYFSSLFYMKYNDVFIEQNVVFPYYISKNFSNNIIKSLKCAELFFDRFVLGNYNFENDNVLRYYKNDIINDLLHITHYEILIIN